MEHIKEVLRLWKEAVSVPELGNGGLYIAPYLAEEALRVKRGQCIVETGPFVGSASIPLAIGCLLNEECFPKLYGYDQWKLTEHWLFKANKKAKLGLSGKEDLRELWLANVGKVYSNVKGVKGDVLKAKAPEEDIGLFVDDCVRGKDKLKKLFEIFEQGFVDGCKVFMLDYGFVRNKKEKQFLETVEYFEERSDSFTDMRWVNQGRSHAAMFTYKR